MVRRRGQRAVDRRPPRLLDSPRLPHPLLRHDNVVLTPHIGGATHETLLNGALMVAAEIERLAAGAPLVNVINRDAVRA